MLCLRIIFPLPAFLEKNGFAETLFQSLYSLFTETKKLIKAIGCINIKKNMVIKKPIVSKNPLGPKLMKLKTIRGLDYALTFFRELQTLTK